MPSTTHYCAGVHRLAIAEDHGSAIKLPDQMKVSGWPFICYKWEPQFFVRRGTTIEDLKLEIEVLEERIAPTANGSLSYEGQPGNQGNGLKGYEGQPGNQGGGTHNP